MLVPAALALAMLLLGKMDAREHAVVSPWWDLPLRVVIATTLLVLITASAGTLGPKWGGLLSPFPIFTFVMATFSHSQGGSAAVWRLIRGVLTGLFAYTAFFVVVALLAEQASLWIVYGCAAIAALGVNGISLIALVKNGKADNRLVKESSSK